MSDSCRPHHLGSLGCFDKSCKTKNELRQIIMGGGQELIPYSFNLLHKDTFNIIDKLASDIPNALGGHAFKMKDFTALPT